MVASALRRAGGAVGLDRLKYVHDEGEKVLVTVVRGTRRFTRELTLGR